MGGGSSPGSGRLGSVPTLVPNSPPTPGRLEPHDLPTVRALPNGPMKPLPIRRLPIKPCSLSPRTLLIHDAHATPPRSSPEGVWGGGGDGGGYRTSELASSNGDRCRSASPPP